MERRKSDSETERHRDTHTKKGIERCGENSRGIRRHSQQLHKTTDAEKKGLQTISKARNTENAAKQTNSPAEQKKRCNNTEPLFAEQVHTWYRHRANVAKQMQHNFSFLGHEKKVRERETKRTQGKLSAPDESM